MVSCLNILSTILLVIYCCFHDGKNVNFCIYSNGPLSLGPGKRDRSIVFRACQLGVLIFRLLTPLSYLYLLLIAISTFCWHPTCAWIQVWFSLPQIGDNIQALTYLEIGRSFILSRLTMFNRTN